MTFLMVFRCNYDWILRKKERDKKTDDKTNRCFSRV
jgi:hypothetical protein